MAYMVPTQIAKQIEEALRHYELPTQDTRYQYYLLVGLVKDGDGETQVTVTPVRPSTSVAFEVGAG